MSDADYGIIDAWADFRSSCPPLDEAAGIAASLAALAPLRARGAEVIVVDGGSARCHGRRSPRPWPTASIDAPRGRAAQMNAGAAIAAGDTLLFLHADTRLPEGADRLVLEGLAASGRDWGRFDVRIDGRGALLPVVAALMNVRSRLTGIATGDQAIFARRGAFERAGGFPAIPLMEDIAFSKAMKRGGPPAVPSRSRRDLRPPLGAPRRAAHHRPHVAASPRVLPRRRSGAPREALRPWPRGAIARRRSPCSRRRRCRAR